MVETALRETQEEIGIDLDKVDVLGNLTRIYTPSINFSVLPVVAYFKGIPQFVPEISEVEEVLTIDLNFFFKLPKYKRTNI